MISLVALRWTLSIKSIKNCWCGDQTRQANSTCGLTKWMYSLSSTWGLVQVPQVLLIKRRTLLAVFTLAMIWLCQDRLWLINTPLFFFFWWQWDTFGSKAVRGFQSLSFVRDVEMFTFLSVIVKKQYWKRQLFKTQERNMLMQLLSYMNCQHNP